MFDPPICINARDRVTPLRKLVDWLQEAGHERITILDNASTWEPLLDYYEMARRDGVTIVYLRENLGSRAIWSLPQPESIQRERWVYTDPDCVPIDECPDDALGYLDGLLDLFPRPKAALGLHLDDVPPDLDCLDWEKSLVSPERKLAEGVFDSLVDTTFALYEPGEPFGYYGLRTAFPYQVRHTSWYVQDLDPENSHYLAHATAGPLGSSWAQSVSA